MRPRSLLCVLLTACSEYDVVGSEGIGGPGDPPGPKTSTADPPPSGAPDLWWDPPALDLGSVCGPGAAEVTVGNQGTSDLIVGLATVSGEGWSLGEPRVPAILAPGERLELPLVSGPGEAVLTVETDDPDTPVIQVPLRAAADAPPSVSLTSPSSGAVLPVDAPTELAALVADDAAAPQDLALSWTSDVDGLLGADPAGPDGRAVQAWDPVARTPGPHLVTVSATDACGQTASESVAVCQQAGYAEESLDLATWHFEGSARYDGAQGHVELTPAVPSASGTAFQTTSTVSADHVQIEFSFYASGGTGADGLSVTALDTTRMTGFVGGIGGGIGYQGLPGWSVELDTWYNAEHGDPTPEDHVSFHFDGDIGNPRAWAALPEMEDGGWHVMTVDVVAPRVRVSVDGVVYLDQDVAGHYAFPAYVGFTAATGGSTNLHLVDALVVTEQVCPE